MTSTQAETTAAGPKGYVSAEVYAQVQQFYARQMGFIDDGKPDEWAGTFTEDAVFEEAGRLDEPVRGREAIRLSSRARQERLDRDQIDFRHWLSMLDVTPQDDGSLHARTYALAMRTPRGGPLDVFASVLCRDHLVVVDGDWQVRHRNLRHDGSAQD
ncbi:MULTISPECIES: nuclear transport factor 2 family protein [unclassified Streptomyces]|uniref:nuclear transport factor 2 family protein n=1 Tax=Streptomyces sp. NPDC055082 TaxID=3365718 RepID=UPI0037CDF793